MIESRRLPAVFAGLLVCLLVPALALGQQAQPAGEKRPEKWASPIEKPGLPNLHKVSDDLYRGAQPEEEGYAQLEKMGIKSVVNLRSMHSEREEVEKTSMAYHRIVFSPFHAEEEDLIRFLKVMADPANRPVFVHCKHGADRTGTMVAFYRILFQGWSKDEAIREMKEGGFGFHTIWKNMIRFIRKTDIDAVRKTTGIQAPKK